MKLGTSEYTDTRIERISVTRLRQMGVAELEKLYCIVTVVEARCIPIAVLMSYDLYMQFQDTLLKSGLWESSYERLDTKNRKAH